MLARQVKVLYIAGTGRSGSTLLSRILHQTGPFVAGGEIFHAWTRGVRNDEPCSCGVPFRSCRFWMAVFRSAYGGFQCDQVREAMLADLEHVRTHERSRLLAPWRASDRGTMASQNAGLTMLYEAIGFESDARVVVDSSKRPDYALLLRGLEGIELYVLHLVRDSRAVAYSLLKKNYVRVSVRGRAEYMSTSSAGASAINWLRRNLVLHVLFSRTTKYLLVRYEDITRCPKSMLRKIGDFVGEPVTYESFLDDRVILLQGDHVLSGNPMRSTNGGVSIRTDDEWRMKMESIDRLLVTASTSPLLLRYGYVGRG